jgi:hypothetical protein
MIMSAGPALRRSAELEQLIEADASGFRISTGEALPPVNSGRCLGS